MTIHRLNDLVSYKALAYAWGSEADHQTITVNGHKTTVRKNLYDFLLIYDGPHIWIDQISINQANVQEKSLQVGMMSQIYTQASTTLVWLGPDPYEGLVSRLIDESLETRDQLLSERLSSWQNDPAIDETDPEANLIFFRELSQDVFRGLSTAQFQALDAFYASTYWSQHWVAQEVAVARKLTVWYGLGELDWCKIKDFSYSLRDVVYAPKERLLNPGFGHCINLLTMVEPSQTKRVQSYGAWKVLLQFCRSSLCANPLDKIYGVQSLIDPRFQVEVDYELSARVLYLQTIEKWFRRQIDGEDDPCTESFWACCVDLAVGMGFLSKPKSANDIYFDIWNKFREAYRLFLEQRTAENAKFARIDESDWQTFRVILIDNLLDSNPT